MILKKIENYYLNKIKILKRPKLTLYAILKENNISIFKFIFNYLNIISQAFRMYFWQYFRYIMLIIWRRTLIIWTSLLAISYEITFQKIPKIFENGIANIINIKKNLIEIIPTYFNYGILNYILYLIIIWIIIIIIKYLIRFLYKLYKFLFIYKDIQYFNNQIKEFYEKKIIDFFETNIKNNIKNDVEKVEKDLTKNVYKLEKKKNTIKLKHNKIQENTIKNKI